MPFASLADESLVAKRETCRLEAKTRIVAKGRVDLDEYRRIVERRSAHVTRCMARDAVVRAEQPAPSKKGLEMPDVRSVSSVRPGRKKARKAMTRIERKRVKSARLKASKGKRIRRSALRSGRK